MPEISLSPDSLHGPNVPLTPSLSHDVALMFDRLGVLSLRASMADLESIALQSMWSITEQGEASADLSDHRPDSVFPGASAMITQLKQLPIEHTAVKKLSPRLWAFAWRIDDRHGVVASARYRDARDAQSDADTAFMRLVCDYGVHAALSGAPGAAEHPSQLVWPAVDRRRRGPAPLALWCGLLLAVASALLAAWVCVAAIPQIHDGTTALQAQAERLRVMAKATMTNRLSEALATGDYGDVQTTLSSFASLGYFQGAVVTNARQRVVSTAGAVGEIRIGDNVPLTLTRSAHVVDLAQGTVRYGQLLTLGAPETNEQGISFIATRVAVVLAGLSAAAAAALLVVRLRKHAGRRPSEAAIAVAKPSA